MSEPPKTPSDGGAPSLPPGSTKTPAIVELNGDESEAQAIIDMITSKFKISKKPAAPKDHLFWKTQPVLHADKSGTSMVPAGEGAVAPEEEIVDGPIDALKTVEEVLARPYPLPDGYEWFDVDMKDDADAGDVYKLLTENYVEDDDNMFRFDYSIPFLRWALLCPGYFMDWHVGIRVTKTKKIVGFITGIPAEVVVNHSEKPIKMAEINFLCVHKKLRSKRLAPVLIKEITRRVNRRDQWQAVYTAGVNIPTPITSCRYWHRSLNPKKLIDVRFSRLPKNWTLKQTIKHYQVPEEATIKGVRAMEEKDVPQVTRILSEYLKKFKLYMLFHETEVAHWFLPRDGVINTYVVENESKEITDFISFYHLPSTVIGHEKYSKLNAAYSFYNVSTKHDLQELYHNALIFAKKVEADVFNALDVMENEPCFKELKFGIGDGHLQYYLYNWATKQVSPSDIGLVLM